MTEKTPQAAHGEAISAILEVLVPLDESGRESVLAAVRAYFGSAESPMPHTADQSPVEPDDRTASTGQSSTTAPKDIRALREEKQPQSDIEMVALVAFYLSEMATGSEKKDAISANELKKYFKQAGHSLPKNASQTIRNARHAGYLESTGEGQFKLNPVGYNLVAHSLPKSSSDSRAKRKRKKRATAKKKRVSKK